MHVQTISIDYFPNFATRWNTSRSECLEKMTTQNMEGRPKLGKTAEQFVLMQQVKLDHCSL